VSEVSKGRRVYEEGRVAEWRPDAYQLQLRERMRRMEERSAQAMVRLVRLPTTWEQTPEGLRDGWR
jgi:hypothetical protein